jgi:hypothetical protein
LLSNPAIDPSYLNNSAIDYASEFGHLETVRLLVLARTIVQKQHVSQNAAVNRGGMARIKCDSDEKWNGNSCEEVDCGKYSTYDSKKDKCVEIECDKGEEYDYKKEKCVEVECSIGYTLDYKKGECVKVECPAFSCAESEGRQGQGGESQGRKGQERLGSVEI